MSTTKSDERLAKAVEALVQTAEKLLTGIPVLGVSNAIYEARMALEDFSAGRPNFAPVSDPTWLYTVDFSAGTNPDESFFFMLKESEVQAAVERIAATEKMNVNEVRAGFLVKKVLAVDPETLCGDSPFYGNQALGEMLEERGFRNVANDSGVLELRTKPAGCDSILSVRPF